MSDMSQRCADNTLSTNPREECSSAEANGLRAMVCGLNHNEDILCAH